jgi:RND family efflux transporter MFP subunit
MFAGVSSGEVKAMLQKRRKWTIGWGIGLAAIAGIMLLGTMQDTAAGGFKVRAARHIEVRAPVTGYLRQVNADEGTFIDEGKTLALMEIPDVLSRLQQKRSEVKEYEAKLKAHETGLRTLPPDTIRLLAEKNILEQDIAAAEAHVKAVEAEVAFLESQMTRQTIASPVSGQVLTPRVSEKIGQYLHDGDLICEMENPRKLEIEISILEQDALRVQVGQKVTLKPRSSATATFTAHVVRLAPVAQPGETQSTVAVYCTLDEPSEALRSGMTGVARIECGRDRIAMVAARRVRHFFRTEFWW